MIKKVFLAIKFHCNIPRIKRQIRTKRYLGKYIKEGYLTLPPNYIFYPQFKDGEVAIDVGCGFEAELSCYLIDQFNLNCFCVDPTKKHEKFLQKIVAGYNGKLTYLQYALCSENCELEFIETIDNESG